MYQYSRNLTLRNRNQRRTVRIKFGDLLQCKIGFCRHHSPVTIGSWRSFVAFAVVKRLKYMDFRVSFNLEEILSMVEITQIP